jgi:phosphoribosylamine---glycine ligase
MRILFISEDLVAGNLAYILKKEGHDVKLYIYDKRRKNNFDNIVKKTNSWRKELNWVGKDGLIIFDCNGFGKLQDDLRFKGYSVVGGNEAGDRLELERQFGSEIFLKAGIKTSPTLNFEGIKKTINFIKKNPGKWVIKQNFSGTGSKDFNYVGLVGDGSDVINVLENYKGKIKYEKAIISLQKKLEGVEIAIGRYFNGTNWIGPVCINLEHKKLFPGDLGPTTSEMGTLLWYDENEKNKLYQETLARLYPTLRKINYKGYIDINCIANNKGIFPLEATARFGSPIIHLQSEIQISPWGEMLKALATGKNFEVKWKKGYGIVVVVSVPTSQPFPFTKADHYISPKGIKIYFDEVAKRNMEHIHFEDVSMRKIRGHDEYYISDDRGYILYVTAVGKTVEKAQKKAYNLLKHIFIPKMFYRNDIGLKFIKSEKQKLKKWGYIK